MIITVKKDDGELVYDVNKIKDEGKQNEARVIISKVGSLEVILEALTFASATHRANLEKLLDECDEAKVEEIVEAEEVSETKKTSKLENSKIEIVSDTNDIDPSETKEWLESLSAVLNSDGKERAQYIIRQLIEHSYREGSGLVMTRNTPYINTIPPEEEKKLPGDQNIERKIRSLIRWNAAAMVVRANKKNPELGGHIGTFASAATLYDVGMNHFWRAKNNKFGGDLIYFQGHSAPGIYARSYLEGRLTEKQLDNFRQEVKPG